jgi:hypothetical protein
MVATVLVSVGLSVVVARLVTGSRESGPAPDVSEDMVREIIVRLDEIEERLADDDGTGDAGANLPTTVLKNRCIVVDPDGHDRNESDSSQAEDE